MAFFKKITSETLVAGRQNVVIMGRKTWFSIPEKFRPLKGRVNIVLSREMKDPPEGVYICRSLQEAVDLASQPQIGDIPVESVYVIGGSSVYQESMSGSYPCRIYLTRVLSVFDCDTFLPTLDDSFTRVENPTDVPTSDIQEEKGIQFKFEVYDKEINQSKEQYASMAESGPIKSTDSSSSAENKPMRFNVMAAMCSGNRGFGFNGKLPWPSLSKDVEYYRRTTATPADAEADKKIIVHIQGRLSWEGNSEKEKTLPCVHRVIISSNHPDKVVQHSSVLKIVPSFEAAVDFCNSPDIREKIDSIWIMGGANVYKAALEHGLCDKLYLTQVHTQFPADVFFPQFEHSFSEIRITEEDVGIMEENGVRYEFKIYKKNISHD